MKSTIIAIALLALSTTAFAASTPKEQLTSKQLNALIANAKTPAEHQRIAEYYRTQAQSYLAESNEHAKMAADFAANPATNNAKRVHGTVNHCQYLASSLKAKSEAMQVMAVAHDKMATEAAQK